GERRLRSMSTASAFSGETYSTRQRRFGSAGGGAAASRSIAHKNAESVLPEPGGAMTRGSSPLLMARHACARAWVGTANAPSNHARVAGENPSRALALLTGDPDAIPPSCIHPLTFEAARPGPLVPPSINAVAPLARAGSQRGDIAQQPGGQLRV